MNLTDSTMAPSPNNRLVNVPTASFSAQELLIIVMQLPASSARHDVTVSWSDQKQYSPESHPNSVEQIDPGADTFLGRRQ